MLYISLLYSNTMFVCVLVAYLLRNDWTDLAKLFLLAPSWSREGFRPKKFRIRDPDPGGTKPDHLEGVEIELWCMNQLL